MDFPLYDTLVRKEKEHREKENIEDLAFLISSTNVAKINEVILALMIHHSIVEGDFKEKIPYSGTVYDKGGGIQYRFKDMPKKLTRILWIYLT